MSALGTLQGAHDTYGRCHFGCSYVSSGPGILFFRSPLIITRWYLYFLVPLAGCSVFDRAHKFFLCATNKLLAEAEGDAGAQRGLGGVSTFREGRPRRLAEGPKGMLLVKLY